MQDILYREKSYSSALALALIGREELGKYRMLLEKWEDIERSGKLPSVEDVQTACVNHVEKQRRALLSFTLTTEDRSILDKALRTQITHKPQDPEFEEAGKIIQTALRSLAKHAPDDRSEARMRALYVDLKESGLDWNRPSQLFQQDAKKAIDDAVALALRTPAKGVCLTVGQVLTDLRQ
jgi:AbiV family abortive infection protein